MWLVECEPGAIVRGLPHRREQMGMDSTGQARFIVGDVEKLHGQGDICIIPGGVVHQVFT